VKFDKKFWTEGPGSFAVAILIALTIRWGFMEAYVIPSGSMLPTLLIHDHIFVNKFVYGLRVPFTEKWLVKFKEPERGEVIVFKYPDNKDIFFIKRIVGIPGDKIYYENGNLYINDQIVKKYPPQEHKKDFAWLRDEDFENEGPGALDLFTHWEEQIGDQTFSILNRKGKTADVFGPYTVPPDSFFVLGDNRDRSKDSRFWDNGPYLPRDYLVGRAMFVWLSCEKTLPVVSFLCDPTTLRWRRFFHPVLE
jgi:signal peptidase I